MGHDGLPPAPHRVAPWGAYTVLEEGDRYKIKRIEVKPGASLSCNAPPSQRTLIVVSGMAR